MDKEINSSLIYKSKNISNNKGFYSVFLSTFSAIFLAELGDKTQVATLLLTAQSGKPVVVFIGAASALIASSLVGVFIGRWLTNFIPTERFNYFAGLLMLGIGALLGLQATNSLIHNIRLA